MPLDELFRLILPLILAAILVRALFSRKQARKSVPDGPENEPYRIFTTEFDVVVDGRNVANHLPSLSPDFGKGYLDSDFDWRAQVKAAEALCNKPKGHEFEDGDRLRLANVAVLLFVDQSGSMKGQRMARVAAGLHQLYADLTLAGASVAVVGFTTAGWHGGFARQKWMAEKKPKRPGRLCALMYIDYVSFADSDWDSASWRQMLNPNLLRENVDGEALLWAEKRLVLQPEHRKVLTIISDGAPVDDSTLLENGPSYLWRHWKKVVSEIEARADVELMAIGIDYRVDQVYARSKVVAVGEDFRHAAWSLLQN